MQSLKIPSNVTSIRDHAFEGCSSLNFLIIHEKKPEKAYELIKNACLNNISNIALNIPIGTGYAYRRHPYFAKFKEIFANVR